MAVPRATTGSPAPGSPSPPVARLLPHVPAGGAEPALMLGGRDTEAERRAAQVADSAQAGRSATGTAPGSPAPDGRSVPDAVAERVAARQGRGRPLPNDLRSHLEDTTGASLDHVGVHDDTEADQLTRGVEANAFAVGSELYFRRGVFDPGTARGRAVISHEAAHAAAPAPHVLQRDPLNPTADPQPVAFAPTEGLSSPQLVDEIHAQEAWLNSHGMVLLEWQDRADRLDALRQEAARRAQLGELWLAPSHRGGTRYFQLITTPHGVMVVELSASSLGEVPRSPGSVIVGEDQLGPPLLTIVNQTTLGPNHTTYQEDNFWAPAAAGAPAAVGGSALGVPAFEQALPSVFAENYRGQGVNTWRGNLGELSTQHRTNLSGLTATDLNARSWVHPTRGTQTNNFPIVDLMMGEQPTSVKISARAEQTGRLDYYRGGYEDLLGTKRPGTHTTAATNLYPELTPAQASSQLSNEGVLSIPAQDLLAFTQDMQLRNQPVTIDGNSYGSLRSLQTALRRGTITQAQLDTALTSLRGQPAPRVRGFPLTLEHLAYLEAARGRFGIGGASLPPAQIARSVNPEWLLAQRYGGGMSGVLGSSHHAGGQGAMYGGVLAPLMYAGSTALPNGPEFHWDMLAAHGGMGALGGYTGGFTTQATTSLITEGAITQGIGGAGFGSRIVGGGAGGAVAAPVFTLGMMGYEELTGRADYTGEDYFGKGARATVGGAAAGAGGALGGALAAGVTGAILGTEVPIVGNIIGFVVGVGIYMLVDYSVGDEVEAGARSVYRGSSGGYSGGGIGSFCFAADTPVLLESGVSRPIGALTVGEVVLCWNPDTERAEPAAIEAVHRHGPVPVRHLRTAEGTCLRVTDEHPLFDGSQWRRADTFALGDTLSQLDDGRLRPTKIVEVRPHAERIEVCNLSVGGTHTYFAANLLVHNKPP